MVRVPHMKGDYDRRSRPEVWAVSAAMLSANTTAAYMTCYHLGKTLLPISSCGPVIMKYTFVTLISVSRRVSLVVSGSRDWGRKMSSQPHRSYWASIYSAEPTCLTFIKAVPEIDSWWLACPSAIQGCARRVHVDAAFGGTPLLRQILSTSATSAALHVSNHWLCLSIKMWSQIEGLSCKLSFHLSSDLRLVFAEEEWYKTPCTLVGGLTEMWWCRARLVRRTKYLFLHPCILIVQ